MTASVRLSSKATVLLLFDMVVTNTSQPFSARLEPELFMMLKLVFSNI